jgi:hypothetical protein
VHRLVNQVADQSGNLVDLASVQVDRMMEKTGWVSAREENASCRVAAAMARLQGRFARSQSGMARLEAISARQQAALARVEANRARIEAQVALTRFTPVELKALTIPAVACPRVRVNIPRVEVPSVHVDLGNGPI